MGAAKDQGCHCMWDIYKGTLCSMCPSMLFRMTFYKPGIEAHIYNPSTWKTETVGLQKVQAQPGQQLCNPVPKKKQNELDFLLTPWKHMSLTEWVQDTHFTLLNVKEAGTEHKVSVTANPSHPAEHKQGVSYWNVRKSMLATVRGVGREQNPRY